MIASAAQIARTARYWTRTAGEAVTVEQIGAAIYGFTSELGTLRLLKKYRNAAQADCGFSTNLGRFYFSIELAA